jgi:hypothetical protein
MSGYHAKVQVFEGMTNDLIPVKQKFTAHGKNQTESSVYTTYQPNDSSQFSDGSQYREN